jgi:hypothetical protein
MINEPTRSNDESADSPCPLSKFAQQLAQRIEKRKATKTYCQAKNEVINVAIKQAL